MAATHNPGAHKGTAFFHDYVGDSPENIQKCLNCTFPECINCLDFTKTPVKTTAVDLEKVKEIKRNKRTHKELSRNEKAILKAYVTETNDYDISKIVGLQQSSVCEARKRLGLPVAKLLPPEDKQLLVNEWLAL